MILTDQIIVHPKNFDMSPKGIGASIPPMSKGEIVEGRVLRAISSNRAILLVKGKALVVKTQIPLKSEGVALYKVEQVTPECVLKSLGASGEKTQALSLLFRGSDRQGIAYKSLIDLIAPLITSAKHSSKDRSGELLHRIWSLLDRMTLAPNESPDPRFLKSVVESSGMIWENKLKKLLFSEMGGGKQIQALIENDLKGLTLGALRDDKAASLISSDSLARFIDSLEQLQLANMAGLEEKGRLLLIIPIQSDDTFQFVQLLIDLSKKRAEDGNKDKEEKALTVSLFLNMSRIGPIRVDASVFEKEIRICFLVCNEQIQSLFNSRSEDLRQQLERHGFSVQQVTCRLEERCILEKTSLVDSLVDFEDHVFSVVI